MGANEARSPPTRIAFPPLGTLSLCAEVYLRALGLQVVSMPPTSRRSLDLGVRHSPEGVCAPCKLLLGNYIEALELGADTLIFLGGRGTCRLGYSVMLQAEKLRALGYTFHFLTLDLYRLRQDFLPLTRELSGGRPLSSLIEPIRLLLGMLSLADDMELATFYMRPREMKPGATERARQAALERMAAIRDASQLAAEREPILALFDQVEHDPERPVLRLGLVGDVYTILTPFFNLNLERELGQLGVEVHRWFHYRGEMRAILPLPVQWRGEAEAQAERQARRYLSRNIGGFALSSLRQAARMAAGQVDGLIHVAPFNCTPEVVAQSALARLGREQKVPVLTLSFDEQTGRAGMVTRLEAFVDMLWARRRARRRGRSAPP